jgi:hypothetical protein
MKAVSLRAQPVRPFCAVAQFGEPWCSSSGMQGRQRVGAPLRVHHAAHWAVTLVPLAGLGLQREARVAFLLQGRAELAGDAVPGNWAVGCGPGHADARPVDGFAYASDGMLQPCAPEMPFLL